MKGYISMLLVLIMLPTVFIFFGTVKAESYITHPPPLINGELREMSSGDFWDLKQDYRLSVIIRGKNVTFTLSKFGKELKKETIINGGATHAHWWTGEDFFDYHKRGIKVVSIPYLKLLNNDTKVKIKLYQNPDDKQPLISNYPISDYHDPEGSKGIHGFEAVFAIAGLLVAVYMVIRRQ